jgi:antitoxin component YwqK of YwqJK toxin-antitoxin module
LGWQALARLEDEILVGGEAQPCAEQVVRLLAVLCDADGIERDADRIFALLRRPPLWKLVPEEFAKAHANRAVEPMGVAFYPDGHVSEYWGDRAGRTAEGEPIRRYVGFHPGGRMSLTGTYVGDLAFEDGSWLLFTDKSACVAEYTMQRGTGVQLRIYPDGTPKSLIEYRDGKRHGVTKLWRQDGSLAEEIKYEAGVQTGASVRFEVDEDAAMVARSPSGPTPRSVGKWDGEAFWARCAAVPLPEVLAEVDRTDWKSIGSCYDASAIPLLFRGIVAPRKQLRVRAIQRLDGEMLHQGSVFACAAPIMRLFSVVHEETTLDRDVDWIFMVMRQPGLWRLVPPAFRKKYAERPPEPLGHRFYADGRTKETWGERTGEEIDGEPVRRYAEYFTGDRLRVRGSYIGDLDHPHGEWIQLSPFGTLLVSYTMDRGTGTVHRYHDRGTRQSSTELRAGKKHGIERVWSPGGTLIEETLHEDGRRHGTIKEWYRDGSPKLEGCYDRGLEHGQFRQWEEKEEGEATNKLRSELTYVRGRLHGPAIAYRDGAKDTVVHYRHGKRHGESLRFDEKGNVVRRTRYERGKPVLEPPET